MTRKLKCDISFLQKYKLCFINNRAVNPSNLDEKKLLERERITPVNDFAKLPESTVKFSY